MNRLGILQAEENTRKSDCINSRFCFYVPVVNSAAVSRDGADHCEKAESGDSPGLVPSAVGVEVKPIFKSQAV